MLVVPPELIAVVETPPAPPALVPPEGVTAPPELPAEPAPGGELPLPELQPSSETAVTAKAAAKVRVKEVFMAERSPWWPCNRDPVLEEVGREPDPLVLERLGGGLGDLQGAGCLEMCVIVAEEQAHLACG